MQSLKDFCCLLIFMGTLKILKDVITDLFKIFSKICIQIFKDLQFLKIKDL